MSQIKVIILGLIIFAVSLCVSCSKKDKESESSNQSTSAAEGIVLKVPFDRAEDFSNGLALVNVGQWNRENEQVQQAYINPSGKVIHSPQFDQTYCLYSFSEGLALLHTGFTSGSSRLDGKWGYIDIDGHVAIEPQFDYAFQFSEGMARVTKGANLKGKYGFIDKKGKLVIPCKYTAAGDFNENLAAVYFGGNFEGTSPQGGKWGFIDKTGKVVIAPQFDYVESFSEGLAKFHLKNKWGKWGKWGFIDKTGRLAIKPGFDYVANFSEGLAAFKKITQVPGNKRQIERWGFIDRTGKIIVEPVYYSVGSFSEGLAWVTRESPRRGGCCEFINENGEVVISTGFQLAHDFSEGLAAVAIGQLWNSRKPLDTTWGFIDKKGAKVIPPQYDSVNSFSEGIAAVDIDRADCKYTYIDKSGREICTSAQ